MITRFCQHLQLAGPRDHESYARWDRERETKMGVLSGKSAVVTGGSRGIGAAIVLRLVRDGASVVFSYRSSEQAAAEVIAAAGADGGRAFACPTAAGSSTSPR